MSRLISLLATLCLVTACGGAEGPVGPAGPAGPVGPPGALTRVEATGLITSTRRATLALPAPAVENGKLPAVACYISNDRNTWLAVAQVPSTTADTYCGITGITSGAPALTIINVPTGYYYYLIAIW